MVEWVMGKRRGKAERVGWGRLSDRYWVRRETAMYEVEAGEIGLRTFLKNKIKKRGRYLG
jgi:hypothetical protein